MTSRLKHKLDIENINVKSSYLNESFVQIGTPLPALADARKDKLEYVPEWQQEVRDEKGRRRFHGAFTGGFSAGYYNSVGSKEGWAPAAFKSSRSNRAQHSQRAEDFMDEEDLAALKEDRQLENTQTFRSDALGSTQAEASMRNSLESLIAPARTSIGQKLLQTQGWKPGQGIGPRISYSRRHREDLKRTDGPVEELEVGLDLSLAKHTFAPRDTRLLVFAPKEDQSGLGFVPGSGGLGLSRQSAFKLRANHVQIDEDEDHHMSAGPSTTSNRHFAYDAAEGDVDLTRPSGSASVSSVDPAHAQNATTHHDGRPVLPGFVFDPLGAPTEAWFALPEVPIDWRPRPARVWGTTRQWDDRDEVKPVVGAQQAVGGRALTHEQRGQALGEALEPPRSAERSVFDFMSQKDRERLQTFIASAKSSSSVHVSVADNETGAEPGAASAAQVAIPPLSPRTAGAALRGFIPYGDDLERQERYRSYLVSQTLDTRAPMPTLRTGSIADINKELDDFAASARIFRPMSYAMSNRFTTGSASLAVSDLKQAKPGLHVFDASKAAEEVASGTDGVVVEERKVLGPRERAAEEGRYGAATRIVKPFYPAKLVCRRIGVQDPHPEGDPELQSRAGATTGSGLDSLPLPTNDATWESSFMHQSSADSTSTAAPAIDDNEERAPLTLADVGMPGDANQGRDTLTYVKPDLDIFKAIFSSDGEDSDGEDDMPAQQPAARDDHERKRKLDSGAQLATDPNASPVEPETSVDLSTFKPKFVQRRQGDGAMTSEGNARDKKRKGEKRKRTGGALSFQADEGEEEWVEKAVPK